MPSILDQAREQEASREPQPLVPAPHPETGDPLVVDVRRDTSGNLVESGGKVVKRLAVCERSGQLILAVEREKTDKSDKSKRVHAWTATPSLADYADAADSGLF